MSCKQSDLKQEVPQSDLYHVGNMAPTIIARLHKHTVQCGNNTLLHKRVEKSNDCGGGCPDCKHYWELNGQRGWDQPPHGECMVNSPSLDTKIKACFCPRTPVVQSTHELPHQNKDTQHLPELCMRHWDKEYLVMGPLLFFGM